MIFVKFFVSERKHSFKSSMFFCLLFFVSIDVSLYSQCKIQLKNFYFSLEGNSNSYPAEIPGCIHTDLLSNKLIPDPFYANNEDSLQWIGDTNWIYFTKFDIHDSILEKQAINMVFEGLDTYSHIELNGVLLASTDNMFRKWVLNIKPYLKPFGNKLKITFFSPYKSTLEQLQAYPFTLPAGNDKGEFKTSVFTRKAPYHYGWDWGPRFITCGIWRETYIEAFNNFQIKDVYYKQIDIDSTHAKLEVELEINSFQSQQIEVKILCNEKNIEINKEFSLMQGDTLLKIPVYIHNPQLWQANGVGIPKRYIFKCIVKSENIVSHCSSFIGLRSIRLKQMDDSLGRSFFFELNGIPLFVKGANAIPFDVFPSRVKKSDYRQLLIRAKEAGFNMLRVWGGGIYESNEFYDLCDSLGIMLWQDFIFACSLYPLEDTMLQNITHEVEDNVKRLRNHASLALWCGNNEISEAWYNWGWQKEFKYSKSDSTFIWDNQRLLFEQILPALLNKYDGITSYHPSSPTYGWGRKKAYTYDDLHYWGVWWGQAPISVYKRHIGRFVSEYGMQSLPNLQSIKRFCPSDQLSLMSNSMLSHQKNALGYDKILNYIKDWFPEPKTFEDFIYFSQLIQAEAMKIAIEAHRKNKPYCMGTLYWQFNDCWPVTSWSGIDYYKQNKALHYYVLRAYRNILIMADTIGSNRLVVYIVSDTSENVDLRVDYHLKTFDNQLIQSSSTHLNLHANEMKPIDTIDLDNALKGIPMESCYMRISLNYNKSTNKNYFFFSAPKSMNLMDNTSINIEKLEVGEGYTLLQLKSNGFCKSVYLTSDQEGWFSDNFFDMEQGDIKNVKFYAPTSGEIKAKWLNMPQISNKK